MNSYFNIMERPEVFISAAALIALVLLVWAQLSARGDLDKDFNLTLGYAWTFLAIFVALVAVGIFVYDNINPCAKGFLIMSFLMTVSNVFITLGLVVTKIVWNKSFSKPLTLVETCLSKVSWSLGWLALFVGLGLISFSLVGILCGYCLWIGGLFVAAAILCAISIVLWHYRRRVYTYIKWYRWKKCRIIKRNKVKKD